MRQIKEVLRIYEQGLNRKYGRPLIGPATVIRTKIGECQYGVDNGPLLGGNNRRCIDQNEDQGQRNARTMMQILGELQSSHARHGRQMPSAR